MNDVVPVVVRRAGAHVATTITANETKATCIFARSFVLVEPGLLMPFLMRKVSKSVKLGSQVPVIKILGVGLFQSKYFDYSAYFATRHP